VSSPNLDGTWQCDKSPYISLDCQRLWSGTPQLNPLWQVDLIPGDLDSSHTGIKWPQYCPLIVPSKWKTHVVFIPSGHQLVMLSTEALYNNEYCWVHRAEATTENNVEVFYGMHILLSHNTKSASVISVGESANGGKANSDRWHTRPSY
jgi:hypothetical protein